MKTILSFLFILISLVVNSQIIEVKIKRWTNYNFPGNISLHEAIEKDSVNSIVTYTGNVTYVFDLDKKVIFMSDDKGWKSVFNVKVIIPTTQSILNVDAEQDGLFYNFLVTENIDNQMSLVTQRFDLVNGKREGFFTNKVELVK
jgi:hypothetical protein